MRATTLKWKGLWSFVCFYNYHLQYNQGVVLFFCCCYCLFVFSRDAPKPKRRAPPRQKEKREKERAPKKEKEVAEIKIEVLDNVANAEEEVKMEEENLEDRDGPRK